MRPAEANPIGEAMKTRHGFVSNSSSSSFVVAVKPGKDEVKVAFSLSELADTEIKTVEELDHWRAEWDEEDNEYYKDIYESCLKALKAGKIILMGSFHSTGDDGISTMLYDRGGLKDEEMPEGGEIIVKGEG